MDSSLRAHCKPRRPSERKRDEAGIAATAVAEEEEASLVVRSRSVEIAIAVATEIATWSHAQALPTRSDGRSLGSRVYPRSAGRSRVGREPAREQRREGGGHGDAGVTQQAQRATRAMSHWPRCAVQAQSLVYSTGHTSWLRRQAKGRTLFSEGREPATGGNTRHYKMTL